MSAASVVRSCAYPLAGSVFGSVQKDRSCYFFIARTTTGTVLHGGLYQRRDWNERDAGVPFRLVAEFTARWRPSGWAIVVERTQSGPGGAITDQERRGVEAKVRRCLECSGHDIVELIGEDGRRRERTESSKT